MGRLVAKVSLKKVKRKQRAALLSRANCARFATKVVTYMTLLRQLLITCKYIFPDSGQVGVKKSRLSSEKKFHRNVSFTETFVECFTKVS